MIGILVMKCAISLAHKSLNPSIELDLKLLCYARANPWKVIVEILYIESLLCITNSKLLRTLYTCSIESVRLSFLVVGLARYLQAWRVSSDNLRLCSLKEKYFSSLDFIFKLKMRKNCVYLL